ncbi:MAG: AbrB/MazE/SpoVT family DNA-binding domain-containing protein [Paenisporosarcina sp.]|nr:AbrB/MazE/SpoVT family DNA-binding domain-containing protein [Paenisporosarcina sp.]
MKATGIVRRIDDLGRVVIPKEIRNSFDIKEGEPLEIFTNENNQIVLKKYNPGCHECGNVESTLHGNKIKLCTSCINKLKYTFKV